jgi:hypothetical protein
MGNLNKKVSLDLVIHLRDEKDIKVAIFQVTSLIAVVIINIITFYILYNSQ